MSATVQSIGQMFAAQLKLRLAETRIPLGNEKEAQAEISRMLSGMAYLHFREFRLGQGDIPDFLIPFDTEAGKVADIVLEVKMNGARAADVHRQLQRYARYDRVGTIILLTNRAMGLPPQIEGKDAYYMSLGQAWL